MQHFGWDLMIVIPSQIVRLLLTNGIIFENEIFVVTHLEMAKKVSNKCNQLLDILMKDLHLYRNNKPSILASAIVYSARKEEF